MLQLTAESDTGSPRRKGGARWRCLRNGTDGGGVLLSSGLDGVKTLSANQTIEGGKAHHLSAFCMMKELRVNIVLLEAISRRNDNLHSCSALSPMTKVAKKTTSSCTNVLVSHAYLRLTAATATNVEVEIFELILGR